MSIEALIAYWIAAGRLHNLLPDPDLSDPIVRTMVISQEIKDLMDGPWTNKSWRKRCGRLRGDLESFVTGELISACMTPYEHRKAYMGRLHPVEEEVWDVRSCDPNPGLRVFGRFAKQDMFVALLWSPRSTEIPWSQRPALGDGDTRAWRDARIECKAEWTKLFPAFKPVHDDDIHGYIKDNVYVV